MPAIRNLDHDVIELMMKQDVWHDRCPVRLDRLRIVSFAHHTFNDNKKTAEGEIMVLDAVAEAVVHIFLSLYDRRFPIECAQTIEHFKGSDQASMAANNTSCYNGRFISQTQTWSMHAYGLAIDINPLHNPVIFCSDDNNPPLIEPEWGRDYVDRSHNRPGMVEDIVSIFKNNGFPIWGGSWRNPIDYHHFQPTRSVAQLLAIMTPCHSYQFFDLYRQHHNLCHSLDLGNNILVTAYQRYGEKFIDLLSHNPEIMAMDVQQAQKALSF